MTILCGTDFTPAASGASETAAALAARLQAKLVLVHVDELSTAVDGQTSSAAGSAGRPAIEEKLRAEASRVGGRGVTIETALLAGHSDEAICAEAERVGADLIVVGALGRRSGPRWRLGSTADRIAQHASCPVLVARNPAPFAAWQDGGKNLSVVIGADMTPSAEAALRWVTRLCSAGPVTLIGAHVYWPPEVRERLHLKGPVPIGKGHPEVDATLARELGERLTTPACGVPLDLRIVGGLGRVADHLVQIAEEEAADLLVVGSHQRTPFERLWHGSISHGVIDAASMSVLCVPLRGAA
ncbi:MAG: universal stress protein [Deltaproteobacteria bacterium]|nr:universal stress protein [Deltaproteobacteria bacterium]